jgi:hypothetical protein
MGPHRNPLTLHEPWRTWHDSGLRFLLREQETQPSPRPETIPLQNTPPTDKPLVEAKAESDWTEPWSTQIRRIQRLRPSVWTYFELGCDLCGRPDPLRRTLWASIIDGLGGPKGSVFFWPLSHLHGETLMPRPDLFWKGIPQINPSRIVIFGEQALRELLPDVQPTFGMIRTLDRPCLYLPGPGDMLPDNRQAKQIVWEFLKSLPD